MYKHISISKLKEINSFSMRKYASLIQRLKMEQTMAMPRMTTKFKSKLCVNSSDQRGSRKNGKIHVTKENECVKAKVGNRESAELNKLMNKRLEEN